MYSLGLHIDTYFGNFRKFSYSCYLSAGEFTTSPMNSAVVIINAKVALGSMNTKFKDPKSMLINYRA